LTTLLPTLIQEYYDLSNKLSKITELIASYGGQIPAPNPPHPPDKQYQKHTPPKTTTNETRSVSDVYIDKNSYPVSGIWKDKILFILKELGTPVTVIELTNILLHKEQSDDFGRMKKTVSQYTSNMSKAGEIGVDDSAFKHKYFLKS